MPKRLTIVFLLLIIASLLSSGPATAQIVHTAQAADEQQIVALVDNMHSAVVARDRALYLSYVDLADPVFALEHTRWADEWSKQAVASRFDLGVAGITVKGDRATGRLTITWTAKETPERKAEFSVQFRRGKDGVWRYAGELWISADTEHFRVHAAPGLEDVAKDTIAVLPGVYSHVTRSLDYTPNKNMEVKLYTTSEALVANTLLSLPPIHGWNEPGESLKLWAENNEPPATNSLAHEFAHFLSFEMAGTAHSRMPWWLEEGLATYVGSYFEQPVRRDGRLERVREWADDGKLVAWDKVSDFNATPVELWQYVYPQGYAFVRYVTETYGEAKRNTWIKAMSKRSSLEDATRSAFGSTFEQIDAQFLGWLKKR